MKILEWNINQRSPEKRLKNNISFLPEIPSFVYSRIMEQKADIVCLTEYYSNSEFREKLENDYWVQESENMSGNQILLAVSKRFAPEPIECVRKTDEKGCYNFLHIRFLDNMNRNLSVIGIRMLPPADAEKQTPPFNQYLNKVEEPFVCVGDFNIRESRMKEWFPNYQTAVLCAQDELEKISYIFPNDFKNPEKITDLGILDHVLLSPCFTATSSYNWDFLADDKIYPNRLSLEINKPYPVIPPPLPDHGMLIAYVNNSGL